MRLLGFDPSLSSSGWCFYDTGTRETVFGSIPVKNLRGTSRLLYIRRKFDELVERFEPEMLAYEGYAMGGKGRVFDIGELGGVLKLHALETGLSILLIPPTSLKQFATGKGNAKKEDMIASVITEWSLNPKNDDEADACALTRFAEAKYFPRKARIYSQHRRAALEGASFFKAINLQTIAKKSALE